jgi:hypothetical protein
MTPQPAGAAAPSDLAAHWPTTLGTGRQMGGNEIGTDRLTSCWHELCRSNDALFSLDYHHATASEI